MKFCQGIDIERYVNEYINNNLDELKKQAIEIEENFIKDNYDSLKEYDELEECYQKIDDIKKINNAYDFRRLMEDIDSEVEEDIEEIVIKELQEKYYNAINLVVDKVEDLLKDNMEIVKNFSHSISAGDFRSFYITIVKEDEDYNYNEKTIRVCDGHDNGRNSSDLEIDFEKLLSNPNYYDIEIEDLIDDLDNY